MKSDKYMIKRAGIEDAEVLADLAIQMWTEHDPEDLEAEFRKLAKNDEAACFIKYVEDKPIAFAQCQLRSCCQNVRNGQKKKAAPNLPATASSAMRTVSSFICLWDLRKPIASYASEKICRSVLLRLLR